MSGAGERPLPSWLTVSTDAAPPTGGTLRDTGAPAAGTTVVSGAASRTRDGLFTEWAAVLAFPDYFGRNWDALVDCLRDLVEERPHTLVVTDAAELLADEPPAQLATLLAVLGSVEGGSVEGGSEPPLRVILRTDPATAPQLCQRLAAAPA